MTCFPLFAHIFQDERRIQLWKSSHVQHVKPSSHPIKAKSTPSLAACTSTEAAPSCCWPQNPPENSHGWLHLLIEGMHLQIVMLVDSGEYIDFSFIFIYDVYNDSLLCFLTLYVFYSCLYQDSETLSVLCVFFCFLESSYFSHPCVGWKFPLLAPLKPINGSLAAAKGDVSVDVIFVVFRSRSQGKFEIERSGVSQSFTKKSSPTSYENPMFWCKRFLLNMDGYAAWLIIDPPFNKDMCWKPCRTFLGPFIISHGYPSICRGSPWAFRHLGAAPLDGQMEILPT